DDHMVQADFDPVSGLGTLRVDADAPGLVQIPELGLSLATGEEARVPVEPWSAETPRLYRGTLTAGGETIALSVGFRRVEIIDGVLRINGARVFFRGVNRHEHHWDTGRTLHRETMIADIVEMKRHNINAVRTSHYPPHPEFLRLCDEYGLWVVEECDLETHGFIYAGWEGNPPADPRWAEAMLDRVRRMVERDKNRPSVVVWSLANESWTGENFTLLEEWVRRRDPSRPILYERDPSYRNSDFYSLMYPDLERLDAIGQRAEARPEGVDDETDARRRGLPFLLVEYAHAMGNGPGSLADYHAVMRAHERICGGFVWEWIDHGFRHADAAGREFIMHGGDVAYRPNGGRYCLDGLLFADRTPSPALAELAAVLQPVEFAVDGELTVRNGRDHADTTDLVFSWRLERDGEERASGAFDVPTLRAGEATRLQLPAEAGAEPGEWWLTTEARVAVDTLWAPAGHVIARHQALLREVARAEADTSAEPLRRRPGRWIGLGPALFDADSGRLVRLGDLALDGPVLDLFRAPTENDRGQGGRHDLAAVWSAVGMNRLLHRTDEVRVDGDALLVRARVAAATHAHAVQVEYRWCAAGDALTLEVVADFIGPWADTPYLNRDIVVPRLGLRLGLPCAYRRAEWFGLGPQETYRDSRSAATVGRFAADIDELQVPYPVPQENGNHLDTRWLALSGEGEPTLRVLGRPRFDFTARRWTSEDLESARHPQDLRDSGRVWLNIDHGQPGLGSASVGPALPERYRLSRSLTRWAVGFVAEL
ncbi:MAG TPA: glycoside hydrolase family 2 TIM barrel-domain containing protein, partial [Arachnia sp.]|nr:glycoside hydrolase family 2 TIM barrel-domain containing protein [Arachnia sp.]